MSEAPQRSQPAAETTAAGAEEAIASPAAEAADSAIVGQRLRAAREAAQLSIAEVAHSLKFSSRQIELLEADAYDALPGSTFVRGFVRGYARLLKLDADELLHLLDARAPIAPAEVRAPTNMGVADSPHSRQLSPLVSATIVLALVALLLGLWHLLVPTSAETIAAASSRIWSVSQLFQKPVPLTAPAPSSARETEPAFPPPAPAEQGPAQPAATPASVAVPVPAPAISAEPQSKPGANLSFVFHERSWVEVSDASRQKLHSAQNPAGSRLTLSGLPPFDIVIGNASKVSLTYGGREIDLAPYTRAEVARLILE